MYATYVLSVLYYVQAVLRRFRIDVAWIFRLRRLNRDASHSLKIQPGMSKNNMPDTFFESILVCVRVDLVPVLDDHAVVTIELVPLIVVRILPKPSPVELLNGLEVLGNALHILADHVVLRVTTQHVRYEEIQEI